MGNWHLSIRGVGAHHNGQPTDADQIAQRVVQELRAAGQQIDDASFTYGQHADVNQEKQDAAQEKVSPAAQPM